MIGRSGAGLSGHSPRPAAGQGFREDQRSVRAWRMPPRVPGVLAACLWEMAPVKVWVWCRCVGRCRRRSIGGNWCWCIGGRRRRCVCRSRRRSVRRRRCGRWGRSGSWLWRRHGWRWRRRRLARSWLGEEARESALATASAWVRVTVKVWVQAKACPSAWAMGLVVGVGEGVGVGDGVGSGDGPSGVGEGVGFGSAMA